MKLILHIWRQPGPDEPGEFKRYPMEDVDPGSSFLEMLDGLNEQLMRGGDEPIAFEHDCREGICGSCGMMINGVPHGPKKAVTSCQLHMRELEDGGEVWIEPFRAKAFPVVKDLVVDRSAFDHIIESGGFISVGSGAAPDANAIPIRQEVAHDAFDAAACIGCGACVAACPNASAMLFTAAKASHLNSLPQGQPERRERTLAMVAEMDAQLFGSCTNHALCEAACPKEISIDHIADLNRNLIKASLGG